MQLKRDWGLAPALGWLVFPAAPVLLEDIYNGAPFLFQRLPPDPRVWGWTEWLVQLGPLLGFGFLVGATLGVPDPPGLNALSFARRWLRRRAAWVAIAPWAGFLVCMAAFWTALLIDSWSVGLLTRLFQRWPSNETAAGWALNQALLSALVAVFAYGWLVAAVAATRRAARIGRGWSALRRGLGVAAAFAGSLFASFWALTEVWRGYFFDARIVPVVLLALTLPALAGCASTISYGEVRRRELFHALLLAWMFGLAVAWRWLSRKRPKPPST